MDENLKKINLRQPNDTPLSVDPSTIPNLVPEKMLKQWMDGDTDPYFKIQQIDYPLVANRYNYTEAFFKSFVKKLERAPIPGSKDGHETSWGKRGQTDIILIGAKFDSKGDGSGSVYFKNYFPPKDNEVLIREGKSDMLEFSLVTYSKDERIVSPDGEVSFNVIESLFGERNDVVGYGEGAMDQKTNNKIKIEGEKMSKKDETLQTLNTLKTNAEITLPEIAKYLGLESLLITDEQTSLISKMNEVKKLCGEVNPVDFINELIKEKKANTEAVKTAKLNEVFGTLLDQETKKENLARIHAETLLGNDELTDEKIAEIKENAVFKKLAAEIADLDSDFNKIGESEGKTNSAESKVMDF